MSSFTVLWLSNVLLFAALGLVLPLLPVYLSINGLSPTDIGIISSASSVASGLSALYLGRLSDVYGRRLSLTAFTLIAGFASVFYPFTTGFAPLLALGLVFWMFVTAGTTVSAAFSIDLAGGLGSGRSFGRFRSGGSVGWIPGTLAGGTLADLLGITTIFYVSAAMFVASAIAAYLVRADSKSQAKGLTAHETIQFIANSRELRVLFVTLALMYVSHASLFYFLPLYLHEHYAAPNWLISSAFAIMAVAEIPAMLYLGSISDKIGRKKVIVACLLAWPVRIGLTALLPNSFAVVLIQMLHGLTFGGLLVVSTAYISDVTPERIRGFSMALYPIAQNVGVIAGAFVSGALIDLQGFIAMYFIIAAYSILPVLFFTSLARETLRRVI